MNPEQKKLREVLSANIKIRRKVMNISQEKLAEATDLSAQTINDIEGGRMWVSDKTIVKLAQVLQVEAYQLLIPDIEIQVEKEKAPFPCELLFSLQKSIQQGIDLQFDKILKSGVTR
ncbi:MAG: helix-turn-helix domain-containing protein [Treponema sp.]|nr:helix-turn-helix domain-containing protein [Treponema sp.]